MAGSGSVVPVLVAFMLVSGVANTILTKLQDNVCVRNCDDDRISHRHHFEQPVWQSAQMFVGEMGCWLVVAGAAIWKRCRQRKAGAAYSVLTTGNDEPMSPVTGRGRDNIGNSLIDGAVDAYANAIDAANPLVRPLVAHTGDGRVPLVGWSTFLLAVPAVCDCLATTLMNVGLIYVVASIYQMTRGAIVLFVGIFSTLFLKRRLFTYQWLALVTVVLGVGIVGLAGALFYDHKVELPEGSLDGTQGALLLLARAAGKQAASQASIRTVFGILLILAAQVLSATQFVVEEWILEHYALEPLRVVGWEGFFGLVFTMVAMTIMFVLVGRTPAGRYGYFDMVEGWRQMTQIPRISFTSFAIMISIGMFNFFGLSVTRTVSATSRSTIDTSRTLFIWMISLFLGWESFKWLQVLGFALLVYGTFSFNGLVKPPLRRWVVSRKELDSRGSLLPEEPIEHS